MSLHYVTGDATAPLNTGGRGIIAHICNNANGWGAGFSGALSKKWPEPEKTYRTFPQVLGYNTVARVENGLYVVNMVAQNGFGRENKRYVNYGALAKCLFSLASDVSTDNATVHMPRIGSGLAGGNWETIEELIDFSLIMAGIDVYVYDLPLTYQEDRASSGPPLRSRSCGS